MKPIPTPDEIEKQWRAAHQPMDIFTYTHSILAPMIEEARVPLCIGKPIIKILAKEGQYVSDDGPALIAADCLFKQDPYATAQQPEPWGEGHRLLVPGKDVWRDGDETWDDEFGWAKIPFREGHILDGSILGRRPLRNPWRRIKDAPPEHLRLWCIVKGGKSAASGSELWAAKPDRTHYLLESDLPPVPQEPRDLEREKFEAAFPSMGLDSPDAQAKEDAWLGWQAARKEAP